MSECAQCLKPATQHCSQCKAFYVSSRECFKLVWKKHKPECQAFQRARARTRGDEPPRAASGRPGVPIELTVTEYEALFAASDSIRTRHRDTVERLLRDDPTLPSRDKVQYVLELCQSLDSTSEEHQHRSLSQKLLLNQAYNTVFVETNDHMTKTEKDQIQKEMKRLRIGGNNK